MFVVGRRSFDGGRGRRSLEVVPAGGVRLQFCCRVINYLNHIQHLTIAITFNV